MGVESFLGNQVQLVEMFCESREDWLIFSQMGVELVILNVESGSIDVTFCRNRQG